MVSALILILLCLVRLGSGNFIDTVRHEITDSGKHVCSVDNTLVNCKPAIMSSATLALPGTLCRDKVMNWYILCHQDGLWRKASANTYVATKHIRRKRGFWSWICFWCRRRRGGGEQKPNTPPELICPTVPPQRPSTGTSMTVTWQEPVGKDKEDGTLENVRRSGLAPGSVFEEGTHTISYHVTDKAGYPASCQITFSVRANYCSQVPWPRHGTRHCTNRDIAGSTCTFSCDKGYELQGPSSVTCGGSTWSDSFPSCTAKSCGPAPTVSNGALTCLGNPVYGTYCLLSCDKGYESNKPLWSTCLESGTWTQPGTCTDSKPPEFTFGCVGDITDYAEKKNQPKSITWSDPEVTDNSASVVTFTYQPTKGSTFAIGRTRVIAAAVDPDGNTAKCPFYITINTLHCPEPDLGDAKLMFDCPDGYGHGYSCSVSCRSGYPLVGSSSILCEKDDSVFPPKASWTWPDDSIKPFCRNTTCPDLPAPKNGGLVCDAWTDGPMCVMMCNTEYDVPRNVPETYACGQQKGIWLPSDIVYDCTVKRRAGQMMLPSEFYYFSGSCQDEATRRSIAERFVHILNTSTTFTGVCGPTVPECRPELVDVKCGTTTRRKRDEEHILSKKETTSIIITFTVFAEFKQKSDEEFKSARSRVENILINAQNALDQMISSGEFDMGDKGVTVQADSFRPGVMDFYCPFGVASYQTGSCRGCPTGTYTDESGQCVDCAVGFYNDKDFANNCTSCGERMSTKTIRSSSVDNCTALCSPGSSSHNGMVPCTPCDQGTYQDSYGATSCTICPTATTSQQGADNISRCVAFDLKISPYNETVWAEATSNMTSLTVAIWFRINSGTGHTPLLVNDSQGYTLSRLSVTDSILVETMGHVVDTHTKPAKDRWQHATLTLDGSTQKVTAYLNGDEVYADTVTSLSDPVLYQGSTMSSTTTSGAILLSGSGIVSRVASPGEVKELAGTCSASFQDSGFSFLNSGQEVIVPSLCDAMDDCTASPCGSHPCTDKINGFACDCQDGWTGTTCDVPPDYCAHHECQNSAVCENGNSNYTCKCLKGFKGELCQEVIVNGQWSPWKKWSVCSVTCGGGNKTRTRTCDSPPPDDDGDDCAGDSQETVTCNPEPCPACDSFPLSLGNEKNCSWEGGMQRCIVTCRRGMEFADSDIVPPVYECGEATGYTWSHQQDDFRKRPPVCKEIVGALSYSAIHTVRYTNLPCPLASQGEADVKSQITTATSDLPCVKDGICSASNALLPCDQSTTQKRSVSPAAVVITITAQMTNSISSDIDVFAYNGTITSNLQNYVDKMLNADMSVQKLINDSQTQLQLTLGGVTYNIDPNTITTVPVITCPDGTVPADGACAECPVGTRGNNNLCQPCEKGTFQSQPASTTCQPCPQGKTTLITGAKDIEECSLDAPVETVSNPTQAGLCPVGTKRSVGQCVLCETGTFRDRTDSATCKPCPQGKTTLRVGAKHISDCVENDTKFLLPIILPSILGFLLILTAIMAFFIWKTKCTRARSGNSTSTLKIKVHPADDPPPPYSEKWAQPKPVKY